MMLKTATILFLVAVCAALPLDDPREAEDVHPPVLDPQAPEPIGDGSDLKTDSTFWGYYNRYPVHRRSYYTYRPTGYYYFHTYPTYWRTIW